MSVADWSRAPPLVARTLYRGIPQGCSALISHLGAGVSAFGNRDQQRLRAPQPVTVRSEAAGTQFSITAVRESARWPLRSFAARTVRAGRYANAVWSHRLEADIYYRERLSVRRAVTIQALDANVIPSAVAWSTRRSRSRARALLLELSSRS
jgi:hypothetical protein